VYYGQTLPARQRPDCLLDWLAAGIRGIWWRRASGGSGCQSSAAGLRCDRAWHLQTGLLTRRQACTTTF